MLIYTYLVKLNPAQVFVPAAYIWAESKYQLGKAVFQNVVETCAYTLYLYLAMQDFVRELACWI